ncbi:MAG: hypothetical protein MHMPM18_002908 [Marteilia pararefringens]
MSDKSKADSKKNRKNEQKSAKKIERSSGSPTTEINDIEAQFDAIEKSIIDQNLELNGIIDGKEVKYSRNFLFLNNSYDNVNETGVSRLLDQLGRISMTRNYINILSPENVGEKIGKILKDFEATGEFKLMHFLQSNQTKFFSQYLKSLQDKLLADWKTDDKLQRIAIKSYFVAVKVLLLISTLSFKNEEIERNKQLQADATLMKTNIKKIPKLKTGEKPLHEAISDCPSYGPRQYNIVFYECGDNLEKECIENAFQASFPILKLSIFDSSGSNYKEFEQEILGLAKGNSIIEYYSPSNWITFEDNDILRILWDAAECEENFDRYKVKSENKIIDFQEKNLSPEQIKAMCKSLFDFPTKVNNFTPSAIYPKSSIGVRINHLIGRAASFLKSSEYFSWIKSAVESNHFEKTGKGFPKFEFDETNNPLQTNAVYHNIESEENLWNVQMTLKCLGLIHIKLEEFVDKHHRFESFVLANYFESCTDYTPHCKVDIHNFSLYLNHHFDSIKATNLELVNDIILGSATKMSEASHLDQNESIITNFTSRESLKANLSKKEYESAANVGISNDEKITEKQNSISKDVEVRGQDFGGRYVNFRSELKHRILDNHAKIYAVQKKKFFNGSVSSLIENFISKTWALSINKTTNRIVVYPNLMTTEGLYNHIRLYLSRGSEGGRRFFKVTVEVDNYRIQMDQRINCIKCYDELTDLNYFVNSEFNLNIKNGDNKSVWKINPDTDDYGKLVFEDSNAQKHPRKVLKHKCASSGATITEFSNDVCVFEKKDSKKRVRFSNKCLYGINLAKNKQKYYLKNMPCISYNKVTKMWNINDKLNGVYCSFGKSYFKFYSSHLNCSMQIENFELIDGDQAIKYDIENKTVGYNSLSIDDSFWDSKIRSDNLGDENASYFGRNFLSETSESSYACKSSSNLHLKHYEIIENFSEILCSGKNAKNHLKQKENAKLCCSICDGNFIKSQKLYFSNRDTRSPYSPKRQIKYMTNSIGNILYTKGNEGEEGKFVANSNDEKKENIILSNFQALKRYPNIYKLNYTP